MEDQYKMFSGEVIREHIVQKLGISTEFRYSFEQAVDPEWFSKYEFTYIDPLFPGDDALQSYIVLDAVTAQLEKEDTIIGLEVFDTVSNTSLFSDVETGGQYMFLVTFIKNKKE